MACLSISVMRMWRACTHTYRSIPLVTLQYAFLLKASHLWIGGHWKHWLCFVRYNIELNGNSSKWTWDWNGRCKLIIILYILYFNLISILPHFPATHIHFFLKQPKDKEEHMIFQKNMKVKKKRKQNSSKLLAVCVNI